MIRNRIPDCYDGRGRELLRPSLIVVHHCSLSHRAKGNPDPIADDLLTGVELAKRFADPGLGTGGRVPYHFLILRSGSVDQLLPLDVRGSHAKGYNNASIAVCYVGESGPTKAQLVALEKVCAGLVMWTKLVAGAGARITGHTLLPGASVDPLKVCPHPTCDLGTLKCQVTLRLGYDWRQWPEQRIRLALDGEGFTVPGGTT